MNTHILMVTFPAQGHINPSLQFAKRLTKHGLKVTFTTSLSAIRRITTTTSALNFVPFSDGHDDGWNIADRIEDFVSTFKRRSSEAVAKLISTKKSEGDAFASVVYTTFMPWVAMVAREFHVPSTLLWIQPAITLDIYYYYFTGSAEKFQKNNQIELPGLPPLLRRDLPTYLSSSTSFDFAIPYYKQHIEILLEQENRPSILVNTFDAFESKYLTAINKFNLLAIGPLIPSAFLDGGDPSDTSFGGDLIKKSEGYEEWLNLQENSSVVYVAFGSYSELPKEQMDEIGKGLLRSGRPFLWVMRGYKKEEIRDNQEMLSSIEELEKQGMIVPWCSQVEVLSHPSVGCFVTHCGWNSSLEGLASGVPMVLLPLWSDQGTNAKIMEECGIGVRVAANDKGIVEEGEIERCLDIVMGEGEKCEELRNKGKQWKKLAKEAVKEGGTSDVNLKVFIDLVVGGNHQQKIE